MIGPKYFKIYKKKILGFSWGSGANLWGHEKDEKFSRPTHYDGMLEVVGVTGIVHLAQIKSGLRTGVRLAQGGHVRFAFYLSFKDTKKQMFQVHIRMNSGCSVPVQVDGEPWLQPPCNITVLRSALKVFKKRNFNYIYLSI